MIVGILGGMGPAATVDFLDRLRSLTPARDDQDHLHLIVDSNPQIPDRNAAIAGTGPSPAPVLAAMARGLAQAGAATLAMPCNTAHAFAADIRQSVAIPLIDMIDETVRVLAAQGTAPVGILAADGCLAANLYQKALATAGIPALVPTTRMQEQFMAVLYEVKAGQCGTAQRDGMTGVAKSLIDAGAQRLVAACTEVALVMDEDASPAPLTISTDVLAMAVLRVAGRLQ